MNQHYQNILQGYSRQPHCCELGLSSAIPSFTCQDRIQDLQKRGGQVSKGGGIG